VVISYLNVSTRYGAARPNLQIDVIGLSHWNASHDIHPIELLMKRGEWLHARQEAKINSIQTIEDAVFDYEEAYRMPPPKGFEHW
jgi:hypothetical protein